VGEVQGARGCANGPPAPIARVDATFQTPVPPPDAKSRQATRNRIAHLERWLIREGHWDHSIPRTIEEAQDKVRATVIDIRDLTNLLPSDDYPARLAVDTNALLDNPDLAAYIGLLGPKYLVHLLPVVLGEVDNLKRAGRLEAFSVVPQ
jgi:hypothetical protein